MTLCYTNRIMQYPFRISLPQIRSMEAVAKQLNTCRYTLIQRVRLRRVIFFKEKHRSDSPPTNSMQQKYESLVFNDKISASELRFPFFSRMISPFNVIQYLRVLHGFRPLEVRKVATCPLCSSFMQSLFRLTNVAHHSYGIFSTLTDLV